MRWIGEVDSRFMMNFFRRWLLKRPEDAFQLRVLRALARIFPSRKFVASVDPDVIEGDGTTYGIYNLRAAAGASVLGDSQFVELVRSHFSPVEESILPTSDADWDTVKSALKPQLCPEGFLRKMPLAHRPLGAGLVIGVVLDGEKAYRYTTPQDLQAWDVAFDDLFVYATENLNEASAGNTPMHYVPGPDRLVAIQTQDGFDAARILVPEFRSFIGSKLGSPFLCAVPNRDFLLCWSHDNSENFLTLTRERIKEDFAHRPYPLSPEVFQASRDTLEPWVPRAPGGHGE